MRKDTSKRKHLKKGCLLLALSMIMTNISPAITFADEPTTNKIQIEENSYYDLKSDGTKGAALDNAVNSYTDPEKGSIEVSKTIEATEKENEFKINLKVTSTEDFQSLELSEDAAVVLVLDRSGSMQWDLEGNGRCTSEGCPNEGKYVKNGECPWSHLWGEPSRFKLMSDSLVGNGETKGFLNNFVADSATAERKVAVVTFGGENEPTTTLGWTDVKTEEGMNTVKTEVSYENIISKIRHQTSQGHGLKEAIKLLENDSAIEDIPNRYVILLTDGRPEGSENIKDGSHTEEQAKIVKNTYNTTLYTIGFGTKNFTMLRSDDKPVNEWLEESVASTGCFIPAQSGSELDLGLEKISQTISAIANAWHVTDPMGDNIVFEGITTNGDTATYNNNTISWDLNKTTPKVVNGKLEYNLQYDIRLDNTGTEFKPNEYLLTNGYTDLSYFFTKEVVENGKVIVSDTSAVRHINFRVPAVQGYLGKLVFNKVSSETGALLTGAEFELTHNADCSVCDGKVVIADQTSSCDADGKVIINRIPSGHEYTLEETKAPNGYIKGAKYNVKVAYGKTYLDGKEVSEATPGIVENEPIAPVTTTIEATKKLETGVLKENMFAFELKDVNGTVIDTQKNTASGAIEFKELTFDAPGTYHYSISEVITDDRDMSYIYDESIYNVEIKVGVNDSDNPTQYVIDSIKYIKNNKEETPVFTNKLRTAAQVVLEGTKKLGNGYPEANAFEFVLKDNEGEVLQKKSNGENGKVVFDALSFDKVGNYTYTITEYISADASENIVYDRTTYDVLVEVTYPENNFSEYNTKVTITQNGQSTDGTFEFINKNRIPAEVVFEAEKKMDGDFADKGLFNFVLEGKDVNGNVISQTKANEAEGKITFDKLYFDKSGTYTYTIYETKGTNIDTIYDKTIYKAIVEVSAPEKEDHFVANVSYQKADGTSVDSILFENRSREHAKVAFSAEKTMDGKPASDEFTFQLKDSQGNVVDVVTNKEDGSILFKELDYGTEGVYTYTISEIKGDNEQIIYDKTVYDVTVTVYAPEGDGAYIADVVYTPTDDTAQTMMFRNETREPAIVSLNAQKTLDGKNAKKNAFEFELFDEEGNVLQTVSNGDEGVITFQDLTFNQTGTYLYTLVEKTGQEENIIYDESEYTVIIDVTVDTDSVEAFSANVKIEKDGEAYEGVPTFANKTAASSIDTGDHANIGLYALLTFASFAVIIGFVFANRKRLFK